MWNKIKLWLKDNYVAFIIFTLIVAASLYLILAWNKWVIFSFIILFYIGWTSYKIYRNQKL